jgi:copper chaperone CopZ
MKKELKFKTNIKCMGCVSQVSDALNGAVGADNWAVDIQSPDKPLTVRGENLDAETVIAAVTKAGFRAEAV